VTTPDGAQVGRLTLALDDVLASLTETDVRELVEWATHHAPPALASWFDQAQAAAGDAHTVMAAVSRVLGGSGLIQAPHAAVPAWIRLNLLSAYAGWATGKCSTCMHSPHAARPEPVFAAAWRPSLVVCASCIRLLELPRGSDADRRCDGCGRVTTGPEHGDGIRPCRAQYGPLLFSYGTCRDCTPEQLVGEAGA
jgi:LSD1 subclass zinc finger protein